MVRDDSEALIDAVADDAAIDWKTQSQVWAAADPELVRSLRIIAAIGTSKRSELASNRHLSRFLLIGYAAVASLAFGKVALASTGLLLRMWNGTANTSDWPTSVIVSLFGVTGACLVVGGTRDRRPQWLGALFVIIASAFSGPLMWLMAGGVIDTVVSFMRVLYVDAFLALGFWLFVWHFPTEPIQPGARKFGHVFLAGSAVIGVVLFGASTFTNLQSPSLAWHTAIPRLPGDMEATIYWPLLFAIAAPGIPFVLWKSRTETFPNRRRIRVFLTAVALGLSPIALAAVLAPAFPILGEQPWRGRVGVAVIVALASLVPSTVYAVAVDRVMDLHLVVRRTIQYALARSSVRCVSVAPLLWLSVDVYRHRNVTFQQYMHQASPLGLVALSAVGFAALTFRHELLAYVDRWFQREATDYTEALAKIERGLRATSGIRDLAGVLTHELNHAIHPSSVGVLVVDDMRGELVSLDGSVPPLHHGSTLLELLRLVRTEVQIGYRASGPLAELLPDADKRWLTATAFQLFFPLIGSNGTLLGLVCIGKCRNELPYTERDCMLVTAMCGQVALKLENNRLRELSAAGNPNREPSLIDWENEPAMRCPECARMWAPTARRCSCGTPTIEAALPLVVKGKFRVERFIGAGGMGVVYLAVDMALDRRVAIKTLPAVHLEQASRLHREARAMATVLHPNLALIYGAESWKQTPLLIFEYLEGGTLLDSLVRGPIGLDEVIHLGTLLADALDRVHASGILHRDIKPSNIGYTSNGVPKLLDFGLAAILDRSWGARAPSVLPTERAVLDELVWGMLPTSSLTVTQQLIGTPLYLSPEAVAGQAPQPSFDLWSLSLVLYESYSGRHPLHGVSTIEVLKRIREGTIPDIRTLRPDCPPLFAAFLNDALSPVAARRPPTAADLRTRLRWLQNQFFPPAS